MKYAVYALCVLLFTFTIYAIQKSFNVPETRLIPQNTVQHIGDEALPVKRIFTTVVCLAFFFIQILPVLVLHPYYGTYYNLCWKATDITKIITVGDASGVALAAKYIEKKANAPQLRVAVSPLGTDFFQPYFRGFAYNTKKNISLPIMKSSIFGIHKSNGSPKPVHKAEH